MDCLNFFRRISGQKVSVSKTQLYFSKNTDAYLRRQISQISGFAETHDLGKYLGVPLQHGGISKVTYNYLVNKVGNRLAGWKAKSLSMVGRVTLVNSVISAVPIYKINHGYPENHVFINREKGERFYLGP
ncbi:hypothetical protein L6164_030701 [Bauhinia variegata]|uniref:Uncharacterized protein n=1 Tax=Bauhinia variegata TaxID=167791 RepID=A0ACB9LD62_BAUVA|nr:hypothetical protein L6164_030701 [Bauhinia variegata]